MSDSPIESVATAPAVTSEAVKHVGQVPVIQNQGNSIRREYSVSTFQLLPSGAQDDSNTMTAPVDPASLMGVFSSNHSKVLPRSSSKHKLNDDPLDSTSSLDISVTPAPAGISSPSRIVNELPPQPDPKNPYQAPPYQASTYRPPGILPSLSPPGGPILLLPASLPPPPGYVSLSSLGIPDPMHSANPPVFGAHSTTMPLPPVPVYPKYYPPPHPMPVPMFAPATVPAPAAQSTPVPMPSAPVASHFSVPYSSSPVTQPEYIRHKLPDEARRIIQEFCDGKAEKPRLEEYEALFSRIMAIPGTEWYSIKALKKAVTTKLGRARKRASQSAETVPMKFADGEMEGGAVESKEGVMSASSGPGSTRKPRVAPSKSASDRFLWPSLTKPKLAKLAILYADNPNPDQTVLQVWSRALKAEQSHVDNWVQLKRCAPVTQNPQLVTPSQPSVSPAPGLRVSIGTPQSLVQAQKTTIHSIKTAPSASPVLSFSVPLSPVEWKPRIEIHEPQHLPPAPLHSVKTSYLQPHEPPAAIVESHHVGQPERALSHSVQAERDLPRSVKPDDVAMAVSQAHVREHLPAPECAVMQHDARQPTPVSASAPVSDFGDTRKDTPHPSTAPSSPANPPTPLSPTPPPPPNYPRDLALFFISQSHDTSEVMSLEEFDQQIAASEGFLADIKNGAFESLGMYPDLVPEIVE